MTLLKYDTEAELADAEARIDAATLGTHPLTDAAGNPITPSHPIIARNPGFANHYVRGQRFSGKDGGLLETDPTVEAALSDIELNTHAAVAPSKPTAPAEVSTYVIALKALLPDAKAGGVAPVIVATQDLKVMKG